jgi:magnesium-transporting ATPase (P-type)
MITGDNVLTAIHVASVLKFIRKSRTALILDQPAIGGQNENDHQQQEGVETKWPWRLVDGTMFVSATDVLLTKNHLLSRSHKFELCITGAAFEHLMNTLEPWKFKTSSSQETKKFRNNKLSNIFFFQSYQMFVFMPECRQSRKNGQSMH